MTGEILIVDDQPGIRLLLTDILTNDGYKVTTANNGKEAIEKLQEEPYALILLDYKLPILDGVQVLEQIEKENIIIPVIVMSGLTEKIEKEVKKWSIVKLLLAKPFNIQEISTAVQEITQAFDYE